MDRRGLNRIVAVAANTFRESVRERVLYNLVLFAILMTLSGLLLGKLSIYQDEKIIKDLGLASMEVFGTLIAVFLGVGLISKEIERRSLYPLLARPLSRGEFLLGKFFGLAFTLMVNVSLMTVGLYATLLVTGRRLDPHLLAAAYLITLELIVVVALALLFSAATSSTVIAAVCATLVVIAGHYSDIVRNMREVAPEAPRWLLETVYYLLPNFHDFDIKDDMVYGQPVPWRLLAFSTLYAFAYAGLALSLAFQAFRARQLQ